MLAHTGDIWRVDFIPKRRLNMTSLTVEILNQILLNDKGQQVHTMSCAPGAKSALFVYLSVGCNWLKGMDEGLAMHNKKHLKNVGPLRHCEPPHAALPFTRCRYCRTPPAHRCPQRRRRRRQQRQRQRVREETAMAQPLWPHRMGPIIV